MEETSNDDYSNRPLSATDVYLEEELMRFEMEDANNGDSEKVSPIDENVDFEQVGDDKLEASADSLNEEDKKKK